MICKAKEKLNNLRLYDNTVRAWFDMLDKSKMSYKTMLENLVLSLIAERESYKRQVLTITQKSTIRLLKGNINDQQNASKHSASRMYTV